jgi:hypothetical protein
MHADDTNYTVAKNGVVVVSGTGPAIRVDDNRLVIRDGPQETLPSFLPELKPPAGFTMLSFAGMLAGHLRCLAMVA